MMELGGWGQVDAHQDSAIMFKYNYLVLKKDDTPWQLVMFTPLAGVYAFHLSELYA